MQMPTAGTDTLYMAAGTGSGGAADSCFDTTCFISQPGAIFSHIPGSNQFEVIWTSTGPLDSLEFWLCGNSDCLATIGHYGVVWFLDSNSGHLTLNSCNSDTGIDTCLTCDLTWYYPDGEICLTRGVANTCWANQICFTFSPPLPPCVIDNLIYDYSDTWTPSYTTDVNGYVTGICFNLIDLTGGEGLAPCETFCFQLPDCCSVNWRPHPPAADSVCVNHLSTVVTGLSTYPGCFPPNTSCTVNTGQLKEADGPGPNLSGSGQNYPNPLDASTGFKTTIPFVTSMGGVATIMIANDKGVKVLTDDETVLGAGQHFFYFSASDLPSGTYYYTIEFPQGVVIANKTMLVIK